MRYFSSVLGVKPLPFDPRNPPGLLRPTPSPPFLDHIEVVVLGRRTLALYDHTSSAPFAQGVEPDAVFGRSNDLGQFRPQSFQFLPRQVTFEDAELNSLSGPEEDTGHLGSATIIGYVVADYHEHGHHSTTKGLYSLPRRMACLIASACWRTSPRHVVAPPAMSVIALASLVSYKVR